MKYQYSNNPRKNRGIYRFSKFEGNVFFKKWYEFRNSFLTKIPDRKFKIKKPNYKIGDDNSIITENFLYSTVIKCIDDLDICEEKVKMFERKIDITHNLKKKYSIDGKIIDKRDAGFDAYAYFAYIMSYKLSKSKDCNLFLTNVLSKTLDIIMAIKRNKTSSIVNFCLRTAISSELKEIQSQLYKNNLKI